MTSQKDISVASFWDREGAVLLSAEDATVIADLVENDSWSEGTSDCQRDCLLDKEWTSEEIGNIVKNSLDHTKEGGTIRISWECSTLMTRIRIADNGKGIALEDIYHIFKLLHGDPAAGFL